MGWRGTSPLLMNPKRSSNRRTSCECKRVSAARARRDVRACHRCSTAVGAVRPNYATGNKRPFHRLQYSQHRQYSPSQHVHHLERCDIRRQLEKLQDLHSIVAAVQRCTPECAAGNVQIQDRHRTWSMTRHCIIAECNVSAQHTTCKMHMKACKHAACLRATVIRHCGTPAHR